MNIPAELVIIANTCDMVGLTHEADVLTDIARKLIQEQQPQQIENIQQFPGVE